MVTYSTQSKFLLLRGEEVCAVPFFLAKNGHEYLDPLNTYRKFALAGENGDRFQVRGLREEIEEVQL